jgi:hypothetical protein
MRVACERSITFNRLAAMEAVLFTNKSLYFSTLNIRMTCLVRLATLPRQVSKRRESPSLRSLR